MKSEEQPLHIDVRAMEPDLSDLQQVEAEPLTAVPVKICEPVESRELPAKRISARVVNVSSTVAGKLLSTDPRRKSATLIPRTQDILIGSSQSQAALTGAWLPGVVPFVTTTQSEVWAMGDGASTDVSVIEEYWG